MLQSQPGKPQRARRHSWRTACVAGVLATVMVAACTSGSGTPSASGRSSQPGGSGSAALGTLRIAYNLEGTATGGIHFDPVKAAAGGAEFGIQLLIYDSLMRRRPDGQLVPALASSATVVDDHTIKLTIRPGLTFSDGSPFDAQAVVSGLERNLAAKQSVAFDQEFFRLTSVTRTGVDALTLHFDDPVAGGWFHFLGTIEIAIAAPDATDLDAHPVGAGPFTVASFVPGSQLVLKRNPAYWDRADIHLATIQFVNTPSDPAALNALQGGQVDFASLAAASVPALQNGGFQIGTLNDSNSLVWMTLCKSSPPLNDPRVRQALSDAIDRDAISKAVFLGKAEPAATLWPEESVYFPTWLRGRSQYDPAKAKQLLATAGHASGLSLRLMPIDALSMPRVAQIIQEEWNQIGVRTSLVSSANFVNDLYVARKADAGLIPVQPADHLRSYVPGNVSDFCGYHDSRIDALRRQILSAPDGSDQAKQAWSDLQHIVVDNTLSIFVVFAPSFYGTTRAVHGLTLVPAVAPYPYLWGVTVS